MCQKRLECHFFFQLAKAKYNYMPRFADTMNNFGVILQLCVQNARIQNEVEFGGGRIFQDNCAIQGIVARVCVLVIFFNSVLKNNNFPLVISFDNFRDEKMEPQVNQLQTIGYHNPKFTSKEQAGILSLCYFLEIQLNYSFGIFLSWISSQNKHSPISQCCTTFKG